MNLTPDAQALVLLCSHLGLTAKPEPGPLSLRDWNPLARRLEEMNRRPGDLLELSEAELRTTLDLDEADANRLARLLERGGAVAIELERLESLGIWVRTRLDAGYPARLRERLGESAPLVLFGAGNADLVGRSGLAVVGSRDVDETGLEAAAFLGRASAACGWVLYSGGARGVDAAAMRAAFDAEGQTVGILADSLEKTIRPPELREAIERGDLALLTPHSPRAGFSVGAAMGRNKLIYALADFAVVVASDAQTGGTWAGASEALKARWVPVFVRQGPAAPEGNDLLLRKGGLPFPWPFAGEADELKDWLERASQRRGKEATGLFDEAE